MAREEFVISPARRTHLQQSLKFMPLPRVGLTSALRQQKIAQPIHMPARPAVARAVNDSIGVRVLRINQRRSQVETRVPGEIRRRRKRDLFSSGGMFQCYFRSVEIHT